jgi:hypothetical protein
MKLDLAVGTSVALSSGRSSIEVAAAQDAGELRRQRDTLRLELIHGIEGEKKKEMRGDRMANSKHGETTELALKQMRFLAFSTPIVAAQPPRQQPQEAKVRVAGIVLYFVPLGLDQVTGYLRNYKKAGQHQYSSRITR